MAELSAARISACPACDAAPLAERLADRAQPQASGDLILSLPAAHCAACITDVERALTALATDDAPPPTRASGPGARHGLSPLSPEQTAMLEARWRNR